MLLGPVSASWLGPLLCSEKNVSVTALGSGVATENKGSVLWNTLAVPGWVSGVATSTAAGDNRDSVAAPLLGPAAALSGLRTITEVGQHVLWPGAGAGAGAAGEWRGSIITDRGMEDIEDIEDIEVDDQLDLAEVPSRSVVRAAASVWSVASTRPGCVTSVSCWVEQVTRLGRLLPRRPAPSHALVCTQTQPPPPHSSRYAGLLTCPCSRTEHTSHCNYTQSEIICTHSF